MQASMLIITQNHNNLYACCFCMGILLQFWKHEKRKQPELSPCSSRRSIVLLPPSYVCAAMDLCIWRQTESWWRVVLVQ